MIVTNQSELFQHGLRLRSLDQVQGELVYEAPASMSFAFEGKNEIGAFTYQGGGGRIRNTRIGRYCSIAPLLTIGDFQHPTEWATQHPFAYSGTGHFSFFEPYQELAAPNRWRSPEYHEISVEIGNDVWIGRNVDITRSLSVGNGAVLSLRSLVTRSVASYDIVGGTPAKSISSRFKTLDPTRRAEVIAGLNASEWWTLQPRLLRDAPLTDPEAFLAWIETQKNEAPFQPKKYRIWRQQGEVHIEPVEGSQDP